MKTFRIMFDSAKMWTRIHISNVFMKVVERTIEVPDKTGILTWMCVYITKTEIAFVKYCFKNGYYEDAQKAKDYIEKRFQMKFEEIEALF